MLEPLHIEATEYSPEVNLNKEENIFTIIGNSIVEDAFEFYNPIIKWFAEYVTNPNPKTVLLLDFEYLNSASTRKLIAVILELEKLLKTPFSVKIIWRYEENDDVMQERGDELISIFDIEIILEQYSLGN